MADPTNISVFSLMKARLQMLGERQKVIAQNVANVSTPGFVPSDINQEAFAATLQRMNHGSTGTPRTAMVATPSSRCWGWKTRPRPAAGSGPRRKAACGRSGRSSWLRPTTCRCG